MIQRLEQWLRTEEGIQRYKRFQIYFFWQNIKGDVEDFIKKCDQCQKQRKIEKVSSELHN